MRRLETKTYRECKLCYRIIDENNNIPGRSTQFPLMKGGRNAYVCRGCAKKHLETVGGIIIGRSKPRRKELYTIKQ